MSEIIMRKDMLAAVTSIISDTESSVRYVGPKPWYERTLNKLKKGLFATAVLGVAAFGMSNMDSQAVNTTKEKVISTFQSVKSDVSKQFDNLNTNRLEQKLQVGIKDGMNGVENTFKNFLQISNDLPQKIQKIQLEKPTKKTFVNIVNKIIDVQEKVQQSIVSSVDSSLKNVENITKKIQKSSSLQSENEISIKSLTKETKLSVEVKPTKIETVAFVESFNKDVAFNKTDEVVTNTTGSKLTESLNSGNFKYFFSVSSNVLNNFKLFNEVSMEENNSGKVKLTELTKQKVEGSSNLVTESEEVIEKVKTVTEMDIMKAKYPNVKFDNLETQRDVSKEFFGVNNFIALAAEMEGFRGDLHKDPAVGLNIGFGYNITKRAYASESAVVEDLKSIGISDPDIQGLIKLAKTPQSKLSKAIREYNKKADLDSNQLISMTQGVALLHRTEHQYRADAANVFNKTWDKKGTNEKEVLTYAAYKAGGDALSKYKQAIKASEYVYKKKSQTPDDLKMIAKHLMFYYKKDGGEYVLDTRASLIAQTFVNPEFLAIQIGKKDVVKTNAKKLNQQRLDFSHLPLSKATLNSTAEQHASLEPEKSNISFNPENMKKTLESVRESQKRAPSFVRMG